VDAVKTGEKSSNSHFGHGKRGKVKSAPKSDGGPKGNSSICVEGREGNRENSEGREGQF